MVEIEGRIRNFRGCEAAEIKLAPIAILAGRNGAGKSSVAQALTAVLTGNPLPLSGVNKSQAASLVMQGATEAIAYLKGEGGMAHIEWPACNYTTDGDPPTASRYAAGLASVALMPAKERAQVLSAYLHADPTREDVAAALTEVELGTETVVAAVWQLIEDHSFDGAHSIRRDKGVELKGEWRGVTKQNYGSRIGVTWAPAGWTLDLDGIPESDLLAAVARAKHEHEQAIGAAAVSVAAHDQMAAEAAELDQRKDALRDFEQTVEDIATALDQAKEARAGLPPSAVESGMPCPHCGAFVVVRRVNLAETRLEAAETSIPQDELKARRMAIAAADGRVSKLQGVIVAANRAVEIARARMQQAAEAANKLAQMPEPATTAVSTDATGHALDTAEARLDAWRRKAQADHLQIQIAGNEKLLAILAADGLRAWKLARVLDLFNSQLEEYAGFADWLPVAVAADMTISYGGRPYLLLSTSEQYRVRAVLQVAMARLDQSAMVVLDAADVLDGTTRSGLFDLLAEAELPALVCLTLTRPAHVPDLAADGLGASYWLEDGICHDLSDLTNAVKEAAA